MAILATQKVLTLDYWKMASDITESDILFNLQGEPVKVKLVQKYRSENCYRVVFNDGLTIEGDLRLAVPLEDLKYRNRAYEYKGKQKFSRPLRIKTVEELLELPLRAANNTHIYSVPTVKPLNLPTQTLPVEPFVFGYWFFNANQKQVMTVALDQADYVFKKFKDAGYKVIPGYVVKKKRQMFTTQPSIKSHLVPTVPVRIPNNYLLASANQRLELLRGIINARPRSYNQKFDRFIFSSQNKHTAQQIQYLAESLGCRTVMAYRPGFKYYYLNIKTRHQLTPLQTSPRLRVFHNRRYVTAIEPLPAQLCVHIETDTGFVAQEGFIACH